MLSSSNSLKYSEKTWARCSRAGLSPDPKATPAGVIAPVGDSKDPEPKDLNYRPQALARHGSVPALWLSRALWSIPTVPVIPASASRLLPIPQRIGSLAVDKHLHFDG